VAPRFFASGAAWRKWLQANHASAAELLVGFYKKGSGRGGLTYPEALDEALCYGWIDGVRRRHHEDSYTIRFSPRRKGSIWSAVNTRRAGALRDQGRMAAPGLRAFEERDASRDAAYSYERATSALDPQLEKRFRNDPGAWAFFEAQPPSYRRMAAWFVMSAKKDETRQRRLDQLRAESACSRRIGLEPLPKPTRAGKGDARGRK
jgi:uncharacterized protein YdeI (YjbR/CyaY-like superfamily)